MNADEGVRQVWAASADLETAQHRVDQAGLDLGDAVARAIEWGSARVSVAEAAGMTTGELRLSIGDNV